MPVNESRVKSGQLRLKDAGGSVWTDLACQASAVKINPSVDQATALETVGGCLATEAGSNTATLDISAIQDFLDAKGLVAFSWRNAGKTVDFEWIPNGANPTEKWVGQVSVNPPIPVGGDANTRLVDSVSWSITALTTPPALGGVVFIGAPTGPSKAAAAPGDVFPADSTVTAADAPNAAKLAGLGFVANPATAWTTGQKVTVGTFDFHWSSTAWAEGAAA